MRGCRYTAPPLTSTGSVVYRTPYIYYSINFWIAICALRFHNPVGAFRRKAVYNNEASIAIRSLESTKEKRKIAELCADFLSSSSTIFMDSSSTAGMVIPYLKPLSSVCVITNGLNNALLLSANTNAKIYVPSGVISTSSNSVLGSDSIAYISSMNADIALISCSGICDEFRITEVSKEQAMLKKMMLHKAKRKVLLCDSNKFSKAFMCDICQTAELDYIITDKVPDKEFVLNCGCKIICG